MKELSQSPITLVQPGSTVYVNIRFYNELWYSQLNLSDCYHIQYYVPFLYTNWVDNDHCKIRATCPLFQEEYRSLNNIFVTLWGSRLLFEESTTTVLVNQEFVATYPQVLPERLRPPVIAPNARPRGRPRRIQL